METYFIEAIKLINPIQLILIGLIVFYFYNRLDIKLTKVEDRLDKKIDNVEKRVEQRITNLETRMERVEDKISKVEDKISKVEDKLEKIQSDFNNRFDKMNDLIIDLYKTLFKKDVA